MTDISTSSLQGGGQVAQEQNKNMSVGGKDNDKKPVKSSSGSVYAEKKKQAFKKRRKDFGKNVRQDEFEQRIIDIARVTRVMAGGKRMRFRACVTIGDKKGKIGVGIAKGADVTMAVAKAVNKAKKNTIEIPIVNETIPHEIYFKKGAAKILLKPARKGKGVIAGGAIRTMLELSGIKNITSKNLGTNNKINIAECTLRALNSIKKVVPQEKKKDNSGNLKKIDAEKPEQKENDIKKE